ncbi:hypothetical protein LX69_00893 [Breznakibacter xylanolyticus]|uniref:Lipoprotein n=1 Tax=Breznakibacter xylanolyticus TaxID=990 RepID=A0A2W7P1C4_9BACT|nr:hypothetical protein [Breznakibacter xylanolyticus]MBN2743380.1 hypothetical protein [Marinilabiliaceae bacterium]PZX19226.1 hypothetical protein LX69_00893 [Breznakibacter xylanolyticus]
MRAYLKGITVSGTALLMVLGTSCNCNRQKSADEKKVIENKVKDVVYPLPTSYEVTEMLNRIGAAYILTLSNPASNATKYMTEKSQALNLGVYGADLSYASTYRQKQETLDYMTASKRLIEELNIAAAIDPDIIDKVEQNADNKDALVKLITDSFYNTYAYLQNNDRAGVSSIVMAGSWIEALYIATHISEDTYNNKEMVKIVMDQRATLKDLMDIMTKDAASTDVQDVLTDLTPIRTVFDSIEGGITEEQFNSIRDLVRTLRSKIVA